MSSIDDRIVQLKFDNAAFESAVGVTLSTLDKLKKSLDFSSSKKGLDGLQTSANKFDLGKIATTVEGAASKFLGLATIGVTALGNLTNKAVNAGLQIVKSLAIDPILGGLKEYETNLNAIQTVLSNTAAAGTTLKDVNAALQELNTYSDKTIYNFGEMARNIGTFTAAGVDLKTSVAAIKGIANLAALSGSNSQQASTAMYQLSQALSAGRVSLQDWNSVVNAGMGGAVFQRALAQNAEKMGTLNKGAVKLSGSMKNVTVNGTSFRNSITAKPGEESWLTSGVLTQTLAQFTGDMTDAQLAAEGFSGAEIYLIQQQAKAAMLAATQVKTLGGVLEVAKETAQSGWAQTWQIVFGTYDEAKSTFTTLSNSFNTVINQMSASRNALLQGWKDLGGRNVAIEAIKNAFSALVSVLKPIKDAFREIFPATTAKQLYDLTVTARDFFAGLKMGATAADNLKRTFKGVFAIFDIGKQIIQGIFSVFGKLFTSVVESSTGVLEFTAKIGDFLVKVDEAIKKGGYLTIFFDKLGSILTVPIKLLGALGAALASIFDGNNATINATGDALGRIGDRLNPLKSLLSTLNTAWQVLLDTFINLSPFFGTILKGISDLFGGIGPAIADSIANGNYAAGLDTINTVLLGGIAILIKKFLSNGINVDIGGGFLSKIGDSFDALTGSLKSMQTQIKAKALLMIAGAVALLTASVVALSLIDSKKLASALAGMAGIFAELMLAMSALGKIAGGAGFIKIPLIAAGLVLLSISILILTAAVAAMSALSWDEILRGLTGVGALLLIIGVAMRLMPTNMGFQAGALILIGVALNLLAIAVKSFADLDWLAMGKGLAGVAGTLLVVGGAMRLMPTNMVLQAGALILIGIALNILAQAVKTFGSMDWLTMGKGLVGIAGSLVAISVAMNLMPPNMVLQAAALILVGIALGFIGKAVQQMGGMSWEEIGKGLVTLAGALVVLAGGLYLMSGSLAGAAALVVASAALAILVPVLKVLGGMSWEEIVKGLVTLAGAFAVMGLAALLLSPVIGPMLLLAGAVALLGLGLALAGVGVLAFATGLTLLIAAGSLGIAALTAIMATVIGIIPTLMMALQVALISFAGAIKAAAPAIISAIVVILISLMDAVIKLTPKVVKTLSIMLDALIALAVKYIPKLVIAGMQIITGVINGITKEMPKIVTAATNLIIAFMNSIATNAPKIVDGAAKAIVKFVSGLSKAIDDNAEALGRAGGKLAVSIVTGLVKGIGAGLGQVIQAARDLAGSALSAAKDWLLGNSPSKKFEEVGKDVNRGFVIGLDKYSTLTAGAAERVAMVAIDTVRDSMGKLSDAFSSEIELNPVIAPVLDLEAFRKSAVGINDILAPAVVVPITSAKSATAISATVDAAKQDIATQDLAATGTTLEFNQYNNSPKALSSAEIYRQTKNQLSIVKGALPN